MLRLNELCKSFGAVRAVDGVTLSVAKGEVLGLLGPNGAGKSTTIGMMTGLVAPDSGSVEVQGVGAPTRSGARRALGVAPQTLAVYEDLSGEENVRFFASMYGIHGAAQGAAVRRALELVGLVDRAGDRVRTYSGGMKRRINLAAAVVHEPPVLLLDEPTVGVDPQSRNHLLEAVRLMASRGTTVVYTTHYMEEAAKLCDRVAIMDKGKVIALGTVRELTATLGGRSIVHVERVGAEAERIESADPVRTIEGVLARGGVSSIRIEQPDLETVFLSLTGRSLRDEKA